MGLRKMTKKSTMIENQNVMFLDMFEKNKILSDLVQIRGKLQENKRIVHKAIYNNTTDIKDLEEKLRIITENLKNKIGV